jgi:hypothetical protein
VYLIIENIIAYVLLLCFSLKVKRERRVTEAPRELGLLARQVLLAPQRRTVKLMAVSSTFQFPGLLDLQAIR